MIGIALAQITLRHPVIGRDQHIGPVIQRRIDPLNRLRQRLDIKRMAEILRRRPHRGLSLFLHQRAEELIVRRGRGRARILRIKRQEQDLLTARLHHPPHHGIG